MTPANRAVALSVDQEINTKVSISQEKRLIE
jgi:hypothetical protein